MAERRGLTQIVNFPRVTGGFREIPSAAGGDPDFASVVLLLDFAGVDGATDITDLSNSAHVETFNNQAEVDTAVTALGENTLLCPAGTPSISYADSVDWDFGTADFTIEFHWQPLDEVAVTGGLISCFDDPNGWALRHGAGKDLEFFIGGTIVKIESFNPVQDTLHHIVVARDGTDLRMFDNGVQIGTPTTNSTNINGGTAGMQIGALILGVQSIRGNIGAVRITKGVARYTANFTPPTEFYPTS